MVLRNPPSPNDYPDISWMQEALLGDLRGKLDSVISLRISMDPDPQTLFSVIQVLAEVKSHSRFWKKQVIHIPFKRWGCKITISSQELQGHTHQRNLIQTSVRKIITQMGPRLYESDPRIGRVVRVVCQDRDRGDSQVYSHLVENTFQKEPGQETAKQWTWVLKPSSPPPAPSDSEGLARCPILDPPDGMMYPESISGIYPQPTRKNGMWWQECHCCRNPFIPGSSATWGGGNLLWVCENCMLKDSR